jgi:hypothetical protein
MNAPGPAVILVPIPVPTPEAGQTYSKRASPPRYPPSPKPTQWPPDQQPIPSPEARAILRDAKRAIAKERALKLLREWTP